MPLALVCVAAISLLLAATPSGCAPEPDDACDPAVPTQSQGLASTCLRAALPVDSSGVPDCKVYVAAAAGSRFCSCADPGYRSTAVTYAALTSSTYVPLEACTEPPDQPCLCELLPFEGDRLHDCLTMVEVEWQRQPMPAFGWCYVDPDQGIGEPLAAEHCSGRGADVGRTLRTLGDVEMSALLVCAGNP